MRGAAAFVLVMLLAGEPPAFAQQPAPAELTRAAGDTVMQQLTALRAGDFSRAYAFASAAIQRQFDVAAFERMVTGGYPEIARSLSAVIIDSHLGPDGAMYLFLTIHGANGNSVDAVYEMVPEGGAWRINGVVTRPAAGERT